MLTDKWETFGEIIARTGYQPEEVIESVRIAFRAGKASMRACTRGEEKTVEWIKENAK